MAGVLGMEDVKLEIGRCVPTCRGHPAEVTLPLHHEQAGSILQTAPAQGSSGRTGSGLQPEKSCPREGQQEPGIMQMRPGVHRQGRSLGPRQSSPAWGPAAPMLGHPLAPNVFRFKTRDQEIRTQTLVRGKNPFL